VRLRKTPAAIAASVAAAALAIAGCSSSGSSSAGSTSSSAAPAQLTVWRMGSSTPAQVSWMNGVVSPKGMPSYTEFSKGITSALDHVRSNSQGNVLLVSSGGPISTAVGHVLGTTPETTIELNLRIRNTSVTEFSFTPKRHMLVTYNTLPHLDHEDHASWVTYS